ncbi:hypothetical protein C6P40_002809 [Pichia californica]|uniref:Uncharacterized protein n=1 Tax=Pichia californica TaxID=460514 RepID=A0A9P6WH74_9ASCO|nr:hypothetical protein C6P42_002284 [[Candida] californica]KAG0687129.1 hypothetical protein C6P40_002809 [[Candida] californica]
MNLVLSVEETNKLRAQVGLKLIPVVTNKNGNGNGNENLNKKNSSIDNRTIILSIEETNKLRKQLGLKLIPVEISNDFELENFKKLENQRQHEKSIDDLRLNLEIKRNDLKTKQRLEKGGILDRIDINTNNKNKNKSTELDFDSWLEEVGKEIKNDKIKKLSFKSKNKKKETIIPDQEHKDNDENEVTNSILTISHNKAAFAKMIANEKEVILTAKDVNVLDNDDIDNFENRQLRREEELKKSINEQKIGKKLVNIDDNDNNNNNNDKTEEIFTYNKEELDKIEEEESKKRKFESLHIESSDDDEEDNFGDEDYDEKTNHNKKISNFIKRDVSKFKKKNKKGINTFRKRIFDTELIDQEFKPITLNKDDENDNDDDELDQMLSNTRHNNLLKKKFNFSYDDDDKINNNIQSTTTTTTTNTVDENIEFLDNLKILENPLKKEDPINEKPLNTDKSNNSEIIVEPKSNVNSRYKAILESESEKNYNTYGISNVLSALKKQKEPLSTDSKTISNDSDGIKIVYTDDYGKVLNTKEAFKYLSHKFHGSKKK